ncbi:hypothetical protein RJ640_016272 [Escallonia rubra]|uniref:Trichome birefringence-like C-terminal domain-containing protein n=1 Tax=Escallonia rubra TaxID=112253 RepID=A0AA88QP65_9ASTE|nr:hypothetical protein RJ640_016272 [Escallonia rubra]
MFVGDSLDSNQWQSLTCMLHTAIPQALYNLWRKGAVSTFAISRESGVVRIRAPVLEEPSGVLAITRVQPLVPFLSIEFFRYLLELL